MNVVPDFLSNLDFRYDIRGETGGSVKHASRRMVEEALESLNEIMFERAPTRMKVDTVARMYGLCTDPPRRNRIRRHGHHHGCTSAIACRLLVRADRGAGCPPRRMLGECSACC